MADSTDAALPTIELLYQYKGCPVRVTMFDPVFRDRVGRYPGVLTEVSEGALTVECLSVPHGAPPGIHVTLELIHDGNLLWCHAHLQGASENQPARLHLSLPMEIQTGQRRRSPRVDAYVPVHYLVGDSRTPVQGVMVDIGAGGTAIEGAASLMRGQIVTLVFSLGSGLFFHDIEAEVLRSTFTRSGTWVAGLRFISLSPEQEHHLEHWIRQRSAVHRGTGSSSLFGT